MPGKTLVAWNTLADYLTSNPQITFFKMVYRRHTPFLIRTLEQYFKNTPTGGTSSAQIEPWGDLVGQIYLTLGYRQTKDPPKYLDYLEKYLGLLHHYIDTDLKILDAYQNSGDLPDNLVVTLDGVRTELLSLTDDPALVQEIEMLNFSKYIPKDPQDVHRRLRDLRDLYRKVSGWLRSDSPEHSGRPIHSLVREVELEVGGKILDRQTGDWLDIYHHLFVPGSKDTIYHQMVSGYVDGDIVHYVLPLRFWFCRDFPLALPIVSIKEPVILNCRFRTDIIDPKVYINYILLGDTERKKFLETHHYYLIELVNHQKFSLESGPSSVRPKLHAPVKFLVWYLRPSAEGHNTSPILRNMRIRVNNQDRESVLGDDAYYNWLMPYIYLPRSLPQGLYFYSFCLSPGSLEPSGSLNFGRLDDFSLDFFADGPGTLHVYAVSYNILEIAKGKASLMFL